MALLVIVTASGKLLVSSECSLNERPLRARLERDLLANRLMFTTLEGGHHLILLAAGLSDTQKLEIAGQMDLISPHAGRVVAMETDPDRDWQPVSKKKKSNMWMVPEVATLELWFKNLPTEADIPHQAKLHPTEFVPSELLRYSLYIILGTFALLALGTVTGSVGGFAIYFAGLVFFGLTICLCFAIPIFGDILGQVGLFAIINGGCFFCWRILTRAEVFSLPSDALAATILAAASFITGWIGLKVHERVFVAAIVHICCILPLFGTLIYLIFFW